MNALHTIAGRATARVGQPHPAWELVAQKVGVATENPREHGTRTPLLFLAQRPMERKAEWDTFRAEATFWVLPEACRADISIYGHESNDAMSWRARMALGVCVFSN